MNPLEIIFNETGLIEKIISYYPKHNEHFENEILKNISNKLSNDLYNILFDKFAIKIDLIEEIEDPYDPWENELYKTKKEKEELEEMKKNEKINEIRRIKNKNLNHIFIGILLSNNFLHLPFLKRYNVNTNIIEKFNCKDIDNNFDNLLLPKFIKILKEKSFHSNNSIKILKIPGVNFIGLASFCGSNIIEIEADELIEVKDSSFSNCRLLKKVSFKNLKICGSNAFSNCENLKNLNISNVKKIGSSAFYNCKSIETIYIPKINTIESDVFYKCSNLKEFDFTNIEFIKDSSFYNCSKLIEINLPKIKVIGCKSFSKNNLIKVTLPVKDSYILPYVHQKYQSDYGQKFYIFHNFEKIDFIYI